MPEICSWPVAVLETPSTPVIALRGVNEPSVVTVGPEARLAMRTWDQNSTVSDLVDAASFQLPSITPLPLPFLQSEPSHALEPRCDTAAESSPGSALNLSW